MRQRVLPCESPLPCRRANRPDLVSRELAIAIQNSPSRLATLKIKPRTQTPRQSREPDRDAKLVGATLVHDWTRME